MFNPSRPSENAARAEPLKHSRNADGGGGIDRSGGQPELQQDHEVTIESAEPAGKSIGEGSHASVIDAAAGPVPQDTPVSAHKIEAQILGQPNFEPDAPPASTADPTSASASTALTDSTVATAISVTSAPPASGPAASAPLGSETALAASLDKSTRSPLKQSGPSLLTQALASARGITSANNNSSPRANTSQHTAASTSKQEVSISPNPSRLRQDTNCAQVDNESHDGLTQDQAEAGPKRAEAKTSAAMATATATLIPPATAKAITMPSLVAGTIASVPASFEPAVLSIAKDKLHEHRNFVDQERGRTSSSLDIDRHTLPTTTKFPRQNVAIADEASTPTPIRHFDSAMNLIQEPSILDDGPMDKSHPQQRPRMLDHRTMTGGEKTEKVWSIGAGEGSEEDGQVEKSVAEAMAGVEHNARSRKASYSLRFFKEGLPPEDKARRKDNKSAAKEKLSPTTEEKGMGVLGSKDKDPGATPQASAGQNAPLPTYSRHASGEAQGKTPSRASEVDYFTFERGDASGDKSASSKPEQDQRLQGHADLSYGAPNAVGPMPARGSEYEAGFDGKTRAPYEPVGRQGDQQDARRDSNSTIKNGSAANVDEPDPEAEDSGEEKISSAVFLPHQDLTEDDVIETFNCRDAEWTGPRPRSLSQSKTRPWLVKADEPEPEPQEEVVEDLENTLESTRPEGSQTQDSSGLLERSHQLGSAASKRDGRDVKVPHVSPRKSRPQMVQDQLDEHVHDHQHDPQEQLEAIELKPYKHQVGGHTTIWRFSRRAVCKQLNSRENEFYEIIERYHRDLLSFLPR